MDKKFFYEKETRAALATFNPYLKKSIKDARMALGIPRGGFSTSEEANKWYDEHYQDAKGEPVKPRNPWNWHLPKELVEMLDSFHIQLSRAGLTLTQKFRSTLMQ